MIYVAADEDPMKPCEWARWMLRHDFVVWDTETTGLGDDAKIVNIAVVAASGEVLYSSLIDPKVRIPKDATAIHGIDNAAVRNAPTFEEAYPDIRRALINQRWAVYNLDYDVPRLRYECARWGLLFPTPRRMLTQGILRTQRTFVYTDTWCAMNMFSRHYGEWSSYHGSYKWKSLWVAAAEMNLKTTPTHGALQDALTTLELIKAMALSEDRDYGDEQEDQENA